jgi:DNA topoisomerase-3
MREFLHTEDQLKGLVAKLSKTPISLEKSLKKDYSVEPPGLFDLSELQREANKNYGMSAQATLEVAQALYEKHKIISYPRTDCNFISKELFDQLLGDMPRVQEAYYGQTLACDFKEAADARKSKKHVDDQKLTDHHAIIPTGQIVKRQNLSTQEWQVFDLVVRRVLMMLSKDYLYKRLQLVFESNDGIEDTKDIWHLLSQSKIDTQLGWKALEIVASRLKNAEKPQPPLEQINELIKNKKSLVSSIEKADFETKKTEPPPRITDANLLSAMETAGKSLEDKELSSAMKERGLGTAATRAQIIELLIKRGFVERQGRYLTSTEFGQAIIAQIDPHVKSPQMTGEWEFRLKMIEKAELKADEFLTQIRDYLKDLIQRLIAPPRDVLTHHAKKLVEQKPEKKHPTKLTETEASEKLQDSLKKIYGFEHFRPYQKEVCTSILAGKNSLLIMPTGSGKSLCYQLPPIVSEGTVLVISPLIALMEDQVQRLRSMGVAAACLHSGMSRDESRDVCIRYKRGELRCLYISPERIGLAAFADFIIKNPPTYLAVDEAHCVSQWGHDFRPDYRLIRERLKALSHIPWIAVTATATKDVEIDIVNQLFCSKPEVFRSDFFRENMAIKVLKLETKLRNDIVFEMVDDPQYRPMIIYVQTRKKAEEYANLLSSRVKTALYHAGMTPDARRRAQSGFLAGDAEVIVATVAFGMGIDKPNIRSIVHLGIPSSLESFYQEIGRAGRDGKPCQALLLWEQKDRATHHFLTKQNYPDPDELQRIYDVLTDTELSHPAVQQLLTEKSQYNDEIFPVALEKLWLHGGCEYSIQGAIKRGSALWRESYLKQRQIKMDLLKTIMSFATSQQCRMQFIVNYFNPTETVPSCGKCDVCTGSTERVYIGNTHSNASKERYLQD